MSPGVHCTPRGSKGSPPLLNVLGVHCTPRGLRGSFPLVCSSQWAQELFPNSFFALAASPGASTASPSRRRVRVLGLCSFKCIFPALRCMSLPVPVNLNRFLAPECVFIFGMWIHFFCL